MGICVVVLIAITWMLRRTRLGTAIRADGRQPRPGRVVGHRRQPDHRHRLDHLRCAWPPSAGSSTACRSRAPPTWASSCSCRCSPPSCSAGSATPTAPCSARSSSASCRRRRGLFVDTAYKFVVALVVLIVVLLVRPQGLARHEGAVRMSWIGVLALALQTALGFQAASYALAATGLNLQFGYTGLSNFGMVGFLLVGAYGMGISADRGWGIWVGLRPRHRRRRPARPAARDPDAAAAGATTSSIVTIATAEILRLVANARPSADITGAAQRHRRPERRARVLPPQLRPRGLATASATTSCSTAASSGRCSCAGRSC